MEMNWAEKLRVKTGFTVLQWLQMISTVAIVVFIVWLNCLVVKALIKYLNS